MRISGIAPKSANIRISSAIEKERECASSPIFVSGDLEESMVCLGRRQTEPAQAAGDGWPSRRLLEFVCAIRLKSRDFDQSKAGDQ